ncbi:hypothetical protein [Sphingomonas soli]|uniref:hypothetical protein n=1 Tax=Sphingomonas soli TaxID=266127 RepID=UPI000831FBFF|nr:hypothetical protein [Sphingomonas soli]
MRSLVLIALAALAGCTQSATRHPSLLPRAAESQSLAEPVRPVPVATPDAALDKKIADLVGQLDSLAAAFNAGAQDAEAKIAVARGLPEGSERWLDAQAALSTLDTLRAPALTLLSDLEEMAIDRGVAGLPPYPALDAAIARAEALSTAQQDRSGALEAALAGA